MLAAVLLGLRLALPIVLAPIVEDRVSRLIGADVEIGDLTFSPIDAVLSLHDVRVHAIDRARDEDHPAIVARHVRADLQWLPLLHRALVVRELGLESARVDLDRLAEGGVALDRLWQGDASAALAPGWTFELDRIALRDARLRLPGTLDQSGEAIEVGLREAQFATQPRRASAFGRAPNLRVDAVLDGGRIRIDGSSDLRDNGLVVNALLRAQDVPVARLRRYLPDIGLSDVGGRLSGQLHYQRDPGRRERASGKLLVRRLTLQVPEIPEPALSVRRAEIDVDAIDLLEHRMVAESVTLHGARLAGRADVVAPLPLLATMLAPEPAAARGARPRARVAPVARPWLWRIGRLSAPRAEVRVPIADGVTVLPASVSADDLGPAAYWSPLRATLRYGAAVAAFDGTTRVGRAVSVAGRVTAADVDVPGFLHAAGVSWADLAQAGRANLDLEIEVEPGAKDEPPVGVKGTLRIADLWLAAPDPSVFAVGAASLDVKLKHVLPAGARHGRQRAPEVAFSDAVVRMPFVQLTRAPEGWLLPPFPPEPPPDDATALGAVAGAAVVAAAAPVATPAATRALVGAIATSVPRASAPDAAEAPPTEIVLDSVRTAGGSVLVTRLVEPEVQRPLVGPPLDPALAPALEPRPIVDFALVEGWARAVRWPAVDVAEVVVQGRDRRFGPLQVGGIASGGGIELQASGQAVPLVALAPYLEDAGLPYPFVDGVASFVGDGWLGAGRWNAAVTLVLQRPHLLEESAELRRQIGMPFDAALGELRGADGAIVLPLTLGAPLDAGAAPIAEQIARGVRDAVQRARQPLPAAPLLIACFPGRADPTPSGLRQLSAVVDMLQRRPDLAVELSAAASQEDRHWLAEQDLADEIEEPGGFMGMLRAFGVRSARERILEALAERASGQPGRLDADDEAQLDRLVAEGPPIPEERLAALAEARLARVADLLSLRSGVGRDRLVIARAQPTADANAPTGVRARVAVLPAVSPFAARISSPRRRRRSRRGRLSGPRRPARRRVRPC